ncbi:hypothetical protein BWI93_21070 [Siphonobacter sp. BAB-5385]|nr:hypothetical protein BWI93_21070 [Siphonobacter sp. BAB-5385]PMD96066.1 hypothetical protein BWI97_12220 [Siphonobacter sp. BAB-5405]
MIRKMLVLVSQDKPQVSPHLTENQRLSSVIFFPGLFPFPHESYVVVQVTRPKSGLFFVA